MRSLPLLLVVPFVATDLAAQLVVPSPQYPTIQSAIAAASASATIQVLPGVYPENLNTQGKALTLYAVSGPATTFVDGGGTAPVVSIVSGEGRSTIVRGFTIRNGYNASISPTNGGAGISIIGSSPTITGCVFTKNTCAGYGGAIGGATGTL